jgi:hypothetical protein
VEFVATDMPFANSSSSTSWQPVAKARGKLGTPDLAGAVARILKTIVDAIAYRCFGFGPITAITRIFVGSTSTTSSSTPVNL